MTKPLKLKHFCMTTRDAAIVMTYSKANISYRGSSNRYNSIYDCVEENYDACIDKCHLKHD